MKCLVTGLACFQSLYVSAPWNPSLPSTWSVWSRANTVASATGNAFLRSNGLSHLQSISSLTTERSAHQEATGRTNYQWSTYYTEDIYTDDSAGLSPGCTLRANAKTVKLAGQI